MYDSVVSKLGLGGALQNVATGTLLQLMARDHRQMPRLSSYELITYFPSPHCNYQAPTVLQGLHCTAGLPLYCRAPTVLQGSNCTAGLPLYCRATTVLQGSDCAAGSPLYCRAPAVLLPPPCTAVSHTYLSAWLH